MNDLPIGEVSSSANTVGVLLISCYELGHQPLTLASAAAHVRVAGLPVSCNDLAVEPLDEEKVRRARLIALSVPMHTAARIAIRAAHRVRELNDRAHVCFFGLYADLNRDFLLETVADSCLGPESETSLVRLARDLARPQTASGPGDASRELRAARSRRKTTPLPLRDPLPPLERYAHLIRGKEARPAGYVASTRGCKYRCRHCPIPPSYNGAFYALPVEAVLADVEQLVAAGARHITFADPDFLNGPSHARRVARSLHAAFPDVTFDYTAKVSHLLSQRELVEELRSLGCVFVVSALESLSNATLRHLDKGHTPSDVVSLIRLCNDIGLPLRPSFVPFTPWDSLQDYGDLLDLVEAEGLIDHIDPVQLTLRLLIPPGSLLLESDALTPHLIGLDIEHLTYRWRHPDPAMDALQRQVAAVAEAATRTKEDAAMTFYKIKQLAQAASSPPPARRPAPAVHEASACDVAAIEARYPRDRVKPPRLSEDWFC